MPCDLNSASQVSRGTDSILTGTPSRSAKVTAISFGVDALRAFQFDDSMALPGLLEQFRGHAPDAGCRRHRDRLVERLQKAGNRSPLACRSYVPAGILHEPSRPQESNGNRRLAERPLNDSVLGKEVRLRRLCSYGREIDDSARTRLL